MGQRKKYFAIFLFIGVVEDLLASLLSGSSFSLSTLFICFSTAAVFSIVLSIYERKANSMKEERLIEGYKHLPK